MRRSSYRADIDGLRAVAVIAVMLFHAFPGRVRGGFMGVDVFFVISGYLITGILIRQQNLDFAGFYRRRVRRLFPALGLMLIAVLLAGWAMLLADDYAELAREATAGTTFVSNIYFWKHVGYFDSSTVDKPLLHLWSLGVEEQFYLVWPLLIWGCRRLRVDTFRVVAALTTLSFVASLALTHAEPTAAFYSPVTRLWELGAGGMLALRPVELRRPAIVSAAGAALVLAGFVLSVDRQAFPGWWALMPVAGTAMIIAAGEDSAFNRLLSFEPLVWIGLISYPLYLWHWPLLSFANIANDLEAPSVAARLALLGTAVVLSAGTYWLLERPMRPGPAIPLVAGMAAVLVTSVTITHSFGVPERPVNHDRRKAFVAYYERLQRGGLAPYYRAECDFLQWGTFKAKARIAPTCVRPGARGTYFLWGDSHAAALSYGLRSALPPGYALAQVATSGCKPWFPGDDPELACVRSNRFALEQIRRLHPAIVFLAQKDGHEERDWDRLAAVLLKLGAGHVVLVGPVPEWKPSLPLVVASHHWPLDRNFVATGLDPTILRTGAIMRRRPMRYVRYVSILKHFCGAQGCLAQTNGRLTAVDYGHLTPKGSLMFGRFVYDRVAQSSRTADALQSSRST